MAVDMAACAALQEEELLTLESIWPDELKVARRQDLVQLTMPVHPDLGGTVQTMVYPHGPQDPVAQLSLDYLPPLSLHVRLAPSYPFIPPDVRITWPWLASRDPTWRRAVEADLHALWQEGEPCIYAYIDHLQSQLLNPLARPLKLFEPPAVPRRGHPTFAARLTTYNTMRKTSSFQEGSYACCICLEERKGKHCVTLESCQHLFCRNCIEMMLSIAIAEGSLDAIACPDPACSKIKAAAAKADSLVTVVATSTIAAYEVERIVSAAAYKRYLWLLDKRRFDADPTTSYCPRCNTGAVAPSEEDYATLRECTGCSYAWCALCRRSYHGVAACTSTHLIEVLDAYLRAGDAEKAALVKRHGRQIVALALKRSDELAFEDWKRRNSTPCPQCSIPVQRSEGCAKMLCSKCSTPFCYVCGIKLSRTDPYAHFNDPGSGCFRRLFDGMEPPPNAAAPDPAHEWAEPFDLWH